MHKIYHVPNFPVQVWRSVEVRSQTSLGRPVYAYLNSITKKWKAPISTLIFVFSMIQHLLLNPHLLLVLKHPTGEPKFTIT